MSLVDAFRTGMSKYVTFSGRARRSELWLFTLSYVVVYLLAAAVFGGLAGATHKVAFVIPIVLVPLAYALPMLAAAIRRLHDTGRSGAYYFMGFIPVAGPIILLVALCQDSAPGDNAYGPNPKGVTGPVVAPITADPAAPAVGY